MPTIRHPDSDDDIVLRIGTRRIRWVIGPPHDRLFARSVLLPWALPDATVLPPQSTSDFTVGVYLNYAQHRLTEILDSGGVRFLLAGDPEVRFPVAGDCFSFVQAPRTSDEPRWTRYCPILEHWAPPRSIPKTRFCSTVEGVKRPWRKQMVAELGRIIGQIDGYGEGYGRPLSGYHRIGTGPGVYEKYQGLESYAFHAAVERLPAVDYLTEKFADAVVCEAIPIYSGCPNVSDYALPECFVDLHALSGIDWRRWELEYARRRTAVLRQKELHRTSFNCLSYFAQLTGHLHLLDRLRPITIETAGRLGPASVS